MWNFKFSSPDNDFQRNFNALMDEFGAGVAYNYGRCAGLPWSYQQEFMAEFAGKYGQAAANQMGNQFRGQGGSPLGRHNPGFERTIIARDGNVAIGPSRSPTVYKLPHPHKRVGGQVQ